MHPPDDEDVITLGPDDEDDDEEYEDIAPGPDERDMDLIDGTWEERYYAGREGNRDWGTVGLAIALLVIIALVLPGVLVLLR